MAKEKKLKQKSDKTAPAKSKKEKKADKAAKRKDKNNEVKLISTSAVK